MNSIIKAFIFVFFTCFSIDVGAQVTGVSYYMEYNNSTCLYDCHIIVTEGNSTGIGERSQFGVQYTIVVPTGSTLSIANRYMPLRDNQNYTGTIPCDWYVGTAAIDALGLGIDYHPVRATLSPASQYNNLSVNDTIKLFSVSVSNLDECGTGVRFFDNDIDPNNQGNIPGDYRNGFTIGGFAEDFVGSEPEVYPSNPDIPNPIIDVSNGININLALDPPTCNVALTCSWTGPNNFQSTEEDVIIDPATSADYGMFEVVVSDAMGCKDSMEILVEEPGQPSNVELSVLDVKVTSTFENIGIHVSIEGDDNLNSSMTIEYRLTGTTDYLPGAVTMRAHEDFIVDGSALGYNFHAGSAMHLQPYSSYDIRITLLDSDGGSETIETTATTKKFPTLGESAEVKYVIPGSGGGDGSLGNPYQGLQFAADNAQPGDILEVGDGIYDPFTINNGGTAIAPLIIRSTNLHGAVIEGANTATGIITIGTAADSIQHITLDGFDIKNGAWGIDAQNTQYLTVKNNKITDVDFGFYNRRENGWEHDQYLHNNQIIGRTPWPQTDGNIPAERGVDIRGNKNVISSNSISDFGDGISTDGPADQTSYGLDIFNNNITRIVDDIIEVDGTISNTRIYKNQGYNGRMGVSIAPIFGGPTYIFRNEFYNLESSAFKMNRGPSGLVILNNSVAKLDRGITSSAGWQNTIFKNNVIFSGHYVMEEFGLVDDSEDDWNNNAYWSARAGTSAEPWFKWDDVKYNDISAVNASAITEGASIEAEFADFKVLVMPTSYSTVANANNIDFGLTANSDLIDSGVMFDNIFDKDVEDNMPDMGAIEFEATAPEYGHHFDAVCDRQDLSNRIWNGNINAGWYHPLNWTPCGVPTKITTVDIPGAISLYPYINTNILISNLNVLEGGKIDLSQGIELRLKGL